jgi:plasmid maintenance system killer protein
MENRRVEREYVDEDLRRLATDPEFRPTGWSDREVREFHRLVQCVRAAHVENDLRNMRVLRIESDDSGDPSRAGAMLSSGRVIDLIFKNSGDHGAVVFGAY